MARPNILFRYWLSHGFGPEYATEMERIYDAITSEMQDLIKRKRSYNIHLRSELPETLELQEIHEFSSHWHDAEYSECYKVLLDDDFMTRQWKNLATALDECGKHDMLGFRVDTIQLSKAVMESLIPGLTKEPLENLYLSRNLFGRDGILFVSKFLLANSTLKALYFCHNPMEDIQSAAYFSEAISKHPSLSNLYLFSSIPKDVGVLSSVISACKNLKILDLRKNNIGAQGAACISEFLSLNPRLRELYLDKNQIGDDGAIILALSLESNSNLVSLSAEHNNITRIGGSAFLKAVYDPSSLHQIYISNHKFQVICYDEKDTIQKEINNINISTNPKKNRKRKLLRAMYNEENDSLNLKYLADMELQLIPLVLEPLQKGQAKKKLTKVFEGTCAWVAQLAFCGEPYSPIRKRKRNDYE